MKKSIKNVVTTTFVASTLLSTVILSGGRVNAQKAWVARKPQEIKIVQGQKEYTIQWGDTLWAISQRTNITISKLAQINNIGNVNDIMTGNKLVLNWDSNGNAIATVVDDKGTVQSIAPITSQDKVDPSKPVGSTVTSDQVANTQDKAPSTNTVTTGSTADNNGSNAGNNGSTTGNTGSNTGDNGSNSGNTGSNAGNNGSTTGNTGSNTGDNGSNSGNTGSNTGDNGSNSGNTGSNTGDNGSNSGNTGSNTGDNGSTTGNTGSNTGDNGSNSGNTGSNTGDNGSNSGNTGSNTGDNGSNSGNTGSNTGNNGGSVTPPVVNQKVLGVPYVNQGSTMLCEGSSLLEALQYKGYTSEGLYSFVNSMPLATNNNPYTGFAGEWRHNVDGTYQGMMAAPVIKWANAHGANATDISGQGIEGVKNSIRKGNPVVTWITYGYESPEFKQMSWGRAVWNGHVVNVDGFNNDTHQIHVVDPVFGARWINETTFTNSFNTTGMAVSVG